MNIARAREIFGDIPNDQLKKKYYKLALINHPDKNGNTIEAKQKFQEINDAYELLKTNTPDDLSSFVSCFADSFYKYIPDSLEEIPKDLCVHIYEFLYKNKEMMHFPDEFLEKVKQVIVKKYENDDFILLHPTIDDLLDHNLFKLEVDDAYYYVPLWQNEHVFDKKNKVGEIVVKCIPILKDLRIDDDNNIYTEITVPFTSVLLNENIQCQIGKKVFEISCEKLQIKKLQVFKLTQMGISKNQTITSDNKSDIYITIHFI
jgi:hypothetical protein